jgi:hypothetical protein
VVVQVPVTVKENVRSPTLAGALNVGAAVVVELSVTGVPAVCVHK